MPAALSKEELIKRATKIIEDTFGKNSLISIEYSEKRPTKNTIIKYYHPERILPVITDYNGLARDSLTGKPPNLTEEEIKLQVELKSKNINVELIAIEYTKPLKYSILTLKHPERFLPIKIEYKSFIKERYKGKKPNLTLEEVKYYSEFKAKELNITLKNVGEFNGSNTRIEFYREDGTIWNTSELNLKNGALGLHGGGYKFNKKGYFYIHEIEYDNKKYYKFGISNKIKERFRCQNYNNKVLSTNIELYECDDGLLIYNLELQVKQTLNCKALPKEIYPDGFTETIEENEFNNLKNIIDIHIIENSNIIKLL